MEDKFVPSAASVGQSLHGHMRPGWKRIRCADLGHSCNWEAAGATEDELMEKVRQHGREAHNLEIGDEQSDRIRRAMKTHEVA